ncbi:MAG: lipoprotein, partial [Flavobacteriales bacterium]
MKKHFLILLIALALASCSEGIKSKYAIENLELTVEGPLFDGPNTLQATHALDLSRIDAGMKAEHIESVKLTKASVSTTDSAAFNSVRNFVLQLTSADAKMQKAGVLNPVAKNTSTVELAPAAESELA